MEKEVAEMQEQEIAEEESAEKPEKPEKRLIKTSPVFKEIYYKCWEKSGGTEDRDRVQIESYQTLIKESVEELYPDAEGLSSFNRADLWRTMKRFGLAESQRKGKSWDLYLSNPNKFNWDCQKKAQYNWLPEVKAKAEPEVALPGIPFLPETPTEITQAELEKAKARWGEFRENMEKLRQNEIECITASYQRRSEIMKNLESAKQTYQALLAGLTEIVTLLERLQELEQKKISLLQGEEENETDGGNEENDEEEEAG